MKKNKILICGGTGFIGRNLALHFEKNENYDVYITGLTRKIESWPDEKFFKIDLTDKASVNALFEKNKFDTVIQAAANTSGSKDILQKPYLHVTDNAIMNSLILQACYDHNVDSFLFISCGVMYNPNRTPVKEEDFYIEEGIYDSYFGVGWTKLYIEKLCKFYSKLGRTKHTVMRLSNAYGKYDKYDLEKSHFFGATISKVMNSEDGSEIEIWGDGRTERDLLYIDDVVNFIHVALEKQKKPYDLYNVGYGKSHSVTDIVNKIIAASNRQVKIKYNRDKPSINTKLSLNSSKAASELGWKPQVSIESGIKKTISWYSKNILKKVIK